MGKAELSAHESRRIGVKEPCGKTPSIDADDDFLGFVDVKVLGIV